MGKLKFRKRRKREYLKKIEGVFSWIFQILVVCIVAFVLVWFWGWRVRCVGDSMSPVLCDGDEVLVNRIVYDTSTPKRNDIIVFRPNGNENVHTSIKRIIGLPGESICIRDGEIYIDGERLKEEIETTEIRDAGIAAEELALSGEEYFVLGDNREAGGDSRTADIGTVKRSEIEGKAWFVVMPGRHFGFLKNEQKR